jgi:hypothetical protein
VTQIEYFRHTLEQLFDLPAILPPKREPCINQQQEPWSP